ncbi:uncharacterized protein IWZ02DRAFT_157660 [Phyllosticta citriasiana]|uniref:uncharacterized protein n=1 Tax=Phyllosticta citriasiana TaxID=595635 RepID=UPI0030FD9FD3
MERRRRARSQTLRAIHRTMRCHGAAERPTSSDHSPVAAARDIPTTELGPGRGMSETNFFYFFYFFFTFPFSFLSRLFSPAFGPTTQRATAFVAQLGFGILRASTLPPLFARHCPRRPSRPRPRPRPRPRLPPHPQLSLEVHRPPCYATHGKWQMANGKNEADARSCKNFSFASSVYPTHTLHFHFHLDLLGKIGCNIFWWRR